MNLWYLFGGLVLLILIGPHGSRLPKAVQWLIIAAVFVSAALGMIWAFWFMLTGQADPSVLGDYIKR